MQVIYQTNELKALCSRFAQHGFVAVDLEFIREKTYYPVLCLIQTASVDEAAIIDPLAPDLDLQPFFELMQNLDVTKVFHSCRQDVEIIYNLSGKIPTPLFDTQIAAMACGFGESISYERLVKAVLNIELDKTDCLSNWQLRPLNEHQLDYACGDVTHLVKLYQYLQQELEQKGRNDWIKEELETVSLPTTYVADPEEIWHKIKFRSHNSRVLSNLKALAAWRERRAQNKNVPRQSVIKDDVLTMIASASPKSKDDLEKIRGMRKDVASGKLADEMLETLANVKVDTKLGKNSAENINFIPSLVEMFKLLLRIVSQEQGVVPRLIASETDLQKLAAFQDKNSPLLSGWRKKVFGQSALKLREGALSIHYNPQTKNIEFIEK